MGVMRDDTAFVRELQAKARALDPPPDPRREEIWARIQEVRRFRRGDRARPARPPRRWWIGLGLAASLVLGVTIGRLTTGSATTGGAVESEAGLPVQLATNRHLARTEALLVSFPADARAGRVAQVADWAYDLLIDTRLLIDSPAGADARLAALLDDLELILAQLAALGEHDVADELLLIQQGIQQNDVLDRLRTVAAEQPLPGT
jgi:hypothetical protein